MSLDVTTREEQLAKMENKRMLEGEAVPINPDDEDDIHLESHNVIRKDFRFGRLEQNKKDNFEVHMQAHRTQGYQKMMQTMQMLQVAKGQGTAGESGPTSNTPTETSGASGSPPPATPSGGM
jgi:hypothetical protein